MSQSAEEIARASLRDEAQQEHGRPERVVVAVSELPGAIGLVRSAWRLAEALRAPWTAIHIETPRARAFTDIERDQIAAAMRLAAQLGGDVASIAAANVIEGLKAFAAEAGATQLVVGKSARSRWFELRHGSVVDRLVRETAGVAVHVLPAEAPAARTGLKPARAIAAGAWGRPFGYLVSAALVTLITAIGVGVYSFGNLTNLALLYLIPVMAAATLYGLRTGLFAGLLSSLAYNFFFLEPLYTFTVRDPENILTILVLLGVAIVTSQLAARVRLRADLAQMSSGQNAALASFARTLAGLSSETELGQTICAEVSRLLGVNAVLLLPNASGLTVNASSPPAIALEAIEIAAADWAMDNCRPAGRGSDTVNASEWLFQPLVAGGRSLGVFGIARDDGGDPVRSDKLPLLVSFIDQAALALERINLVAEMATVSQLKERDRLRATLLSSLGHDLRTPLTTILASAAQIRAAHCEGLDPALADGLVVEAERLDRFLANLLDMARVEAGALRLQQEAIDLTDAVAAAVHDLRNRLGTHPIRLSVPVDLPLVRADPQLLHHCLINLLDNAGKYSDAGGAIMISGTRDSGSLSLDIIDEGPGLPKGREADVFETFTRIEGSDSKGGTGLGLAIVRGFAEAMGMMVSAANRGDGRGARFSLLFPEELIVRSSPDEPS